MRCRSLAQNSSTMTLLMPSPPLQQASSVLELLVSYRNTKPEFAGTFQIHHQNSLPLGLKTFVPKEFASSLYEHQPITMNLMILL